MKKKILHFVIMTLFHYPVLSQNRKLDSLKTELQKARQDTTQFRIYIALINVCDTKDNLKYAEPALELADKLLAKTTNAIERKKILQGKAILYSTFQFFYADNNDTPKMHEYGKKLVSVYREVHDTENIVNAYLGFSKYYLEKCNYPNAIEYYQEGLALSKEMNYTKGVATFLLNMGRMFAEQGENKLALENYQKALSIRTEQRDTIRMAKVLMLMANSYGALHNIPKAVELYNKSIILFDKKKDRSRVQYTYDQLGRMYEGNNDLYNALNNFKLSLAICEEINDDFWAIGELCNIGQIYAKMGNINTALNYHLKALSMAEGRQIEYEISVVCGFLATDYLKLKEHKKAKQYGERCLNLMKKQNNISEIVSRELLMSQIDSACGLFNKAFEHYKQYIILRDKLKSKEVTKESAKQQYQSEYEKQKAIDRAIAKKEIEKQKIIRNSFVGGFAIMFLLAGVSYRNFKRKKKDNQIITQQKKEVENQKHLIEEKNKEILDSIEYALRIQNAILPTQKIVKQYLEYSFILYKPKDIVAGDFYWMENIDDVVLFAACDCTGHGVPGAMVSVVCHNALNRAVREFGLTQPAAILDKTTEIVLENFSKSDEEIHDGMDISICALNTKTKTLEWAGANNSLLFINNGQLTETKADKQCIGYNYNVKPFTNHQFYLQPDTSIYLFTDGYADQFGGQPERKLTKNRFKELLLSIQHLPIQQQATELDNFITNYKQDIEQTDDILVIGVRV
jgi:serine phosphatase RsbU (regulator of sigma subunit)